MRLQQAWRGCSGQQAPSCPDARPYEGFQPPPHWHGSWTTGSVMQDVLDWLAAPLFAVVDFALDTPVAALAIASAVACAMGMLATG